MQDFVEITWSAGSIDEARRVSRYLVQERLAACAQIIPWIESIYEWNNQLETAQESKVVIKALKNDVEEIVRVIEKNTHYEVPEILWRSLEGVSESYAKWLSGSVKNSNKT